MAMVLVRKPRVRYGNPQGRGRLRRGELLGG